MVALLEDKLEKATGSTVTTPATDPDRRKPRCTAAQYSFLLAESRSAHLEGLARARQQKPKRRRDLDARLYEEYVKALEKQKKLLLFQFQGQHNQYTKDFLAEAWIKNDPFEIATKWKEYSKYQLHSVLFRLHRASGIDAEMNRMQAVMLGG
eukprot:s5709_g3.t1